MKYAKAAVMVLFAFAIGVGLLSKKEMAGRANQGQPTFVVRVEVDHGNSSELGTGTLVRSDLVLTCHHVIRDARAGDVISVTFKDGMIRSAEIVRTDKTQDLALLSIKPVIIQAARPAREAARKGDQVVICGFPGGKRYEEVGGRVVGFNSPTRGGEDTLFTVSNRCQSGMSGGPVLNMDGEFVGVLFGTLKFANCTGLDAVKKFLDK